MAMHDPPHPGGVLRRQWFEPMGISITQAAKHLGISRKALSELVNEHAGISPDMAVRLSITLDTSSELWMNMQSSYDLWRAEQHRNELTVLTMGPWSWVNKPVSIARTHHGEYLRKIGWQHTKNHSHAFNEIADPDDEKSRFISDLSSQHNLIYQVYKRTDNATKTPALMESV